MALSFVLIFQFLPRQLTLEPGDVSPRDIRASSRITYVSDVETEAARRNAESAVAEVYDYDPADTSIARGQINHARKIFEYAAALKVAVSHPVMEVKAHLEGMGASIGSGAAGGLPDR